jgi:hypothetical protein
LETIFAASGGVMKLFAITKRLVTIWRLTARMKNARKSFRIAARTGDRRLGNRNERAKCFDRLGIYDTAAQ